MQDAEIHKRFSAEGLFVLPLWPAGLDLTIDLPPNKVVKQLYVRNYYIICKVSWEMGFKPGFFCTESVQSCQAKNSNKARGGLSTFHGKTELKIRCGFSYVISSKVEEFFGGLRFFPILRI